MYIKSLEVKGLYGFLDKKILFTQNINILVGINGSGKTSILNIINWILNLNLQELCTTEFKKIILTFEHDKKQYKIIAEHNNFIFTLKLSQPKTFHPLKVKLTHTAKSILNNPSLLNQINEEGGYQGLSPTIREIKTWNFLSSLPKPIVIGLDRTILTSKPKNQKILADEESNSLSLKRKSIFTPLNSVKHIIDKAYSNYKNVVINLNNQLKHRIMLSAFDTDFFNLPISKQPALKNINTESILKLQHQVDSIISEGTYTSKADQKISRKRIKLYFSKLTRIIKKKDLNEQNNLLFSLNARHFKKVSELIKDIQDYENKVSIAYSKLAEYLTVINQFYKDSMKRIVVNNESGKISFNLIDKRGNLVGKNKDIEGLSSGEKQLLILFTYLSFSEGNNAVFIIDEPELSLHPKWQEEFLGSIEKLLPHDRQVITATHSPAIVGKRKSYCRSLLPY